MLSGCTQVLYLVTQIIWKLDREYATKFRKDFFKIFFNWLSFLIYRFKSFKQLGHYGFIRIKLNMIRMHIRLPHTTKRN